MKYTFDMWVRVGEGEETFVSDVQDAGDLYKHLETLRCNEATEHQYRGAGYIEVTFDNCRPVKLRLSHMEKSLYHNGYTLRTLERAVTDAFETQQMFQHLSTEPQNYTTMWEELL